MKPVGRVGAQFLRAEYYSPQFLAGPRSMVNQHYQAD